MATTDRPRLSRTQVEWVASALDDISALPDEVKLVFGYAIHLAQVGGRHPDAKPLKGDKDFKGAGVLEVVEDHDGDTYRAIYTLKFAGVVYVLDAFQKKSKKGRATPKQDIERIKSRLKLARQHYEAHYLKRAAGARTRSSQKDEAGNGE